MPAELPGELILLIAGFLTSERDISAFARTSHHHYLFLVEHLYKYNIKHSSGRGIDKAARFDVRTAYTVPCRTCSRPHGTRRITFSHPLLVAAEYGHVELMRCLLEEGSDPHVTDIIGQTPLTLTVAGGFLPVVRALYEAGAKDSHVHEISSENPPPIEMAVNAGHVEIAKYILEKMDDKDARSWTDTLLRRACELGNMPLISYLLDRGADINRQEGNHPFRLGDTPLTLAAAHGHVEAVQLLLDNGADVHRRVDGAVNRLAVLDMAVINGHDRVVKVLLEHDATNLNEKLTAAIEAGHRPVVEVLLTKHQPRPGGAEDPLVLAAGSKHRDLVNLFLDKGFDEDAALQSAVRKSQREIVKLLLRRRTGPNRTQLQGAVAAALDSIDFTMIELLLDYGALIDPADQRWYQEHASKARAMLAGQFAVTPPPEDAAEQAGNRQRWKRESNSGVQRVWNRLRQKG
ncbi:ankyrin repeat-containing domain protein [Aspergillus lucknowensis]|uniref:Ankyrin repeat-containing domain protein n=1 Tax=Aspergillus lucknowensis TaxID=176173 RepID=A0ABR4LNH8_9EURO